MYDRARVACIDGQACDVDGCVNVTVAGSSVVEYGGVAGCRNGSAGQATGGGGPVEDIVKVGKDRSYPIAVSGFGGDDRGEKEKGDATGFGSHGFGFSLPEERIVVLELIDF